MKEENIPVLRRPILKLRFSKVFAKPIAGASPSRPAGLTSNPMFICPFRNVPVVSITLLLLILLPQPASK